VNVGLPLRATARTERLSQTSPKEYAVRFVFGGLVTVAAGLIATRWGPVLGGLFLAFPSILPASLTLVKDHAKLSGAAGADALGAGLGSAGLVLFALVGWALTTSIPGWAMLMLATLAWTIGALAVWAAFQSWRLRRRQARKPSRTRAQPFAGPL
jgi:Protein of unknown function (DUF3147)